MLAIAVLIALVPAAHAQQAPCTKTWDGPASGPWATAASWQPDGVPGTADVVCAGAGTAITFTTATSVAAIRSQGSLIGSGSSSTLTLTSPTEPSSLAAFTMVRTTAHDAPLEVGSFVWDGGPLNGAGTLTVTGSTHFKGDSSSLTLGAGHGLVTAGTGIHDATMTMGLGATWTNSAAIGFASGSVGASAGVPRPVLTNAASGSFTRSSGTSTISITPLIENDGVISAAQGLGRFSINDGAPAASSGLFEGVILSAEPAAPLRLAQGAAINRVRLDGDVVLPPGGTVAMTDVTPFGGVVRGDGILILRGTIARGVGSDFGTFGSLGRPDTPLVILAEGATLTSDAALRIGSHRFEIEPGATLVLERTGANETSNWFNRGIVENRGTVRLHSGAYLPDNGTTATNGTDEGGLFINRGLVVKETNGSFDFRPQLLNDGVVQIDRGTLTARRFEQTPDGVLRFDIGGTTAGSGHGVLSAGTLRHQGRIEATLTSGFTPAAGSRFNVITAGVANRSGAFTSSALAGLTLDETQNANIGLVAPGTGPAVPGWTLPVGAAVSAPAVVAPTVTRAATRSARLKRCRRRAARLTTASARRRARIRCARAFVRDGR